jgi:alpha-beta hydrolase superfamily lysophospholipase
MFRRVSAIILFKKQGGDVMEAIEFRYTSPDGESIYAIKWRPEQTQQLKGVVQIVHGMAEHIGRYERFAEALCEAGFIVVGNDHRGHGKTAINQEDPIFFHEEEGWQKVIEDIRQLNQIVSEENFNLPIFIFGHSMGSFLTKGYIQNYGAGLSGVILSGTGYMSKWTSAIPKILAKRDVRKYGERHVSQTLAPIIGKLYNRSFQPIRTESDWLSRDTKEVERFIEDPLCGRPLSAGFYRDMMEGMAHMDDPYRVAQVPKYLPIFLIGGDKDPVGGFGKGMKKTKKALEKQEIQDVEMKLYEGARHELLNETIRDQVTKDLIEWLEIRTSNKP